MSGDPLWRALSTGYPYAYTLHNYYPYYDDVNRYTTPLRALEKGVNDNPNSAPERFLLGYQYLMTGARPNAEEQFAEAVKLTPKDKLAAHYLAALKANQPL